MFTKLLQKNGTKLVRQKVNTGKNYQIIVVFFSLLIILLYIDILIVAEKIVGCYQLLVSP